ncbi:hypothetical protein H2248_004058 [Termitomyces sp. 'cryptogamus']|nr:hypothetical protein H2248_004058 [Termitomyces sp. 'cryptogamus']
MRFCVNLLNVLLAPLKDELWSSDRLQMETGILALGVMAEGCIEAIEPHLSTLVPYLIDTLNDPKASWTTKDILEEHKNQYFTPTMEGVSRIVDSTSFTLKGSQLLQIVLDNKQVQEAGCSAFATL